MCSLMFKYSGFSYRFVEFILLIESVCFSIKKVSHLFLALVPVVFAPSLSGQQNHVSLHLMRHKPHTNCTTETGGIVVTAKDRPSLVKCPLHSHIVLCPAVPCSSVGWDDDRNKWGGGETHGGREREGEWFRAVCSFCFSISLWCQ